MSWIRKEAPSVWWFTPEEADVVQRLALSEPGTLRSLLLFACEVQPQRKAKPEGTRGESDAAEAATSRADEPSDEAITIPDDLTV